MTGLITLTTDFGSADGYLAAMRGVLCHDAPAARLIDITHAIVAQDIRAAGRALVRAWPWFPAGSVHLAVIDPGVGSARRGLFAACAGHWFVLPDNGLLGAALGDQQPSAVYRIDCPPRYRQPVSRTFHGRDIFAPVAAALANGVSPDELGVMIDDPVRLPAGRQVEPTADGGFRIPIVGHDHFGNLLTEYAVDDVTLGSFTLDGQPLRAVTTYAEAAPGEAVVLVGSGGELEVAVVNGSAAARLGSERMAADETLAVHWRP